MSTDRTRRNFVGVAGITAATAATAALLRPASAQTATGVPKVEYEIKPLPFDPKSIAGLSEKILVSHHDNNYAGAVKRLNTISAQLAGLDFRNRTRICHQRPQARTAHRDEFDDPARDLSMAWREGGRTGRRPCGCDVLRRDFGSFERWQTEFSAMGKAEGGGSGWVVLAYSPHDKRLINQWAMDHTTTLAGGRPVFVLDMFEHAYQMDYGAKAADYVEAIMQVDPLGQRSRLVRAVQQGDLIAAPASGYFSLRPTTRNRPSGIGWSPRLRSVWRDQILRVIEIDRSSLSARNLAVSFS